MGYTLEELVDIGKLQALTDQLYQATAIPSSIIDTNGKILTGSGWQRICTDFHRQHPEAVKDCIASDTAIRQALERGDPFSMYTCPRGLTDASIPIIIDGEHLANAFAGQLLLEEPEEATMRFFRSQGRELGFDEEEYIRALREVPVMSLDTFRSALLFLAELAQMIAELGLQRQRELEVKETLRRREAHYRLVVENQNDLVVQFDPDNRILYASPSYCKAFGKSENELVSERFIPMIHEDDRDVVRKSLQTLSSPPHRTRHEERALTVDGWRWFSWSARAVLSDSGAISSIVSVGRDITTRKQAEEELLKFRTIADRAAHGTAITELDGTLVYVNEYFAGIHGYSQKELVGKKLSVFHNEDQLSSVQQIIASMMETGSFHALEVWHVHKDGHEFPMLMSGAVINSEEGQPLYLSANGIDLSERHRAEERYRIINDSSHDFIFSFDTNGRFTSANKSLCDALNTKEDEIVGKTVAQLGFPKQQSNEWDELRQRVFETRATVTHVSEIPIPDGSSRHYEANLNPLFDRQGETIGISGSSRDITERVLANLEKEKVTEQLQQAQRMESIGRLAGGIAHDFNNLLTGINGYAEMIITRLEPDDPIQADLEEIKSAGERAAGLTAQLLAFSRKQVISPKVIQPNVVLETSQRMLRRIIGEDVELRFIRDETRGRIKVDPAQLDQILMNLAVNARDAMPNGGQLTVEIRSVTVDRNESDFRFDFVPGDYVMIAVKDTGHGMDEETASKVFEPFFSTKSKDHGTGLGLATVYGIVKQNSGFITVQSKPKEGATFKVYLPRIFEETTDIATKGAATLPRGSETVLLVEDEQMVRTLAKKILKRQGYTVLEARNGNQAISNFAETSEQIDLLLTDVVMPDMNGKQLREHLRRKSPSLKTLYMSGYTEDVIASHGILEEGVRLLQKPFNIEELSKAVRAALDSR